MVTMKKTEFQKIMSELKEIKDGNNAARKISLYWAIFTLGFVYLGFHFATDDSSLLYWAGFYFVLAWIYLLFSSFIKNKIMKLIKRK